MRIVFFTCYLTDGVLIKAFHFYSRRRSSCKLIRSTGCVVNNGTRLRYIMRVAITYTLPVPGTTLVRASRVLDTRARCLRLETFVVQSRLALIPKKPWWAPAAINVYQCPRAVGRETTRGLHTFTYTRISPRSLMWTGRVSPRV